MTLVQLSDWTRLCFGEPYRCEARVSLYSRLPLCGRGGEQGSNSIQLRGATSPLMDLGTMVQVDK